MRHDKPDANRAAIVAELRERGYLWLDIGGGVDGLCIGFNHNTQQVSCVLVEIKNPERPIVFTTNEKKFMAELNDKGYHGIHVTAQDTTAILRWFGQL